MKFNTERQKASQNFPYPADGATVRENPPTLIWVPCEGADKYTVTLRREGGEPITLCTDKHYATPRSALAAGEYEWDIVADNGAVRGKERFTVPADAIDFVRPDAKEVMDSVPSERPRHLFLTREIEGIKEARATALEALARNVALAMSSPLPNAPRFHEDDGAVPYREYFGEYRNYMDRDLVALSLGYHLLGDEAAGARAVELLMRVLSFGSGGPCSLHDKWGDEIGLSNARCLPSVFDLLYPLLDAEQRAVAVGALLDYAKQCYDRILAVDYTKNPADSHVGRIPAYLGEIALVLKGEDVDPALMMRYLELALDVYCGIFPYYGGEDGSWAEGPFYSTSYTKWYIPFFSAVERFTGNSLAARPFYRNYVKFVAHFCDPAKEIHPFGDGYWSDADSPEWPGFFAQNPYRFYAERFGDGKICERAEAQDRVEILKLHLLDAFIPRGKRMSDEPIVLRDFEVFADGGFVAMHSDIDDPDGTTLLARASRFGSDSHRHADQGSFVIFAGKNAMITPSGYFGRAYGTRHHREWTNTTAAHNALLFDGAGQPTFSMQSVGKIAEQDENARRVVLDMSGAYGDKISLWQREITMEGRNVRVRDTVEAPEPVEVSYCLHSMSEPHAEGKCLRIERCGRTLTAEPVGDALTLGGISDEWGIDLNDGVPEEYHVSMPKQYHITYLTERKCRHEIEVLYKID